jgi:hypothetical protein
MLQKVARIVVPVGAAGSLGLMFYAGRRQSSVILMVLFAIWVLSPFLALFRAIVRSERRPIPIQTALSCVILLIVAASLGIYGGVAFDRIPAKTGFIFLVVPFASWLLIAIIILMARFTKPSI